MSFRGSLIIEGEHEWWIHVADNFRTLPRASGNPEIVAAVKELQAESKGIQSGCILAPASASCFFCRLHLPPELDSRDRSALIYELENHLPIDAESMAADFAMLPPAAQDQTLRGHSISAVAVEVDTWKPLADALEAADIPVTSITPSAALAIAALQEKHSFNGTNTLVLCHDDHADLITLADDRICTWKHIQIEAKTLQRHKSLDLPAANQILVVSCTEAQSKLIRDNAGPIQIESEALTSLYLLGGKTTFSNPASTHFNLRRGHLATEDPLRPLNRQLAWLALAIATCLITVILGSWYRTTRIENKISENLQAQSAAFRDSFPDTRVPASLLRRVRSEHTRIMGSRNATKQIEVPSSATEVMGLLLASLPAETRVRISSIDIRDGDLDLTFQVQHFVEAGVIAEALSQGGFDVSQPATAQKDAKTFESTIKATWQDREPATNSQPKYEPATSIKDKRGKSPSGTLDPPLVMDTARISRPEYDMPKVNPR